VSSFNFLERRHDLYRTCFDSLDRGGVCISILLPFAFALLDPVVTVRQVVEERSLLRRITDPFGDILQEVRAPFRGEVLTVVGTPPVNVGEAVVFLGCLPER
jgi:hypothetical protein